MKHECELPEDRDMQQYVCPECHWKWERNVIVWKWFRVDYFRTVPRARTLSATKSPKTDGIPVIQHEMARERKT